MNPITNDKLTIIGAAGMIGSNMAQTALMLGLTPNICLYDPYGPALEGVAEELLHCAFDRINLTYTTDIAQALSGASYIVHSGGSARQAGMTREDLLKGNAAIAQQFGNDIKHYCPDVKHIVIVFNPADITGLITLVYSGISPERISTLAALDSTRLRSELAKYFKVLPHQVVHCRTYGGHGEQMALFASSIKIGETHLTSLIDTPQFPLQDWQDLQQRVVQGGATIIKLRGRSSFQSPAYLSVLMIAAAMGDKPFLWPAGVFVRESSYRQILMAMDSVIDIQGVRYNMPKGTEQEMLSLQKSYEHLCRLRDEVISMGLLPKIESWKRYNPYLE